MNSVDWWKARVNAIFWFCKEFCTIKFVSGQENVHEIIHLHRRREKIGIYKFSAGFEVSNWHEEYSFDKYEKYGTNFEYRRIIVDD